MRGLKSSPEYIFQSVAVGKLISWKQHDWAHGSGGESPTYRPEVLKTDA